MNNLKMNNCLIILNQQPFIPPFMLSAITCAKDRYDDVYYVNTKQPNNKSIFRNSNNVHFLDPSPSANIIAKGKAVLSLFSAVVFSDVRKCIKEKGFSFHIIKLFLLEQYVHQRLFPIAKGVICNKINNSQITLLSTWFDACAYTAATLKQTFPLVKAVSMAHSYEILTIRNPYVPYKHIEFKHHHLDGVFFISHIIREMYLSGVSSLPKQYLDKTHVCYLGTYKDKDLLNHIDESKFNICTCSRVVALKRLDVLMEALKRWNYGKIRWTHLGDGPLLENMKKEAECVTNSNPMVEITFTGRIPNEAVKAYYADHPIDVFVNLSDIEGLPISIMEAISYGIPVIATNVGGTSEIVNSETGFLLDADITPESVKNALLNYYNYGLETKKRLRDSAFNYWKVNFDAKTNLKVFFNQVDDLNIKNI